MIIGTRLHIDLLVFSVFFSFFFCFLCSIVDSLLGFWVFLELAGLSIIPSFFYRTDSSLGKFYNSLLTYVIMSALSSVMLFGGILFVRFYYFIYLGFVLKFGLFPFRFWVYKIFVGSNWLFIFFLSVVMKFPILFFCFLFEGIRVSLVIVDRFVTIMMCTFFFWLFRFSWQYIWGHISIVSVSTLMVACFCGDSRVCFFVFFYYFVWALLCIVYFFEYDYLGGNFWCYFFLLLVTPLSLPLFYKFGVCFSILNSSVYLLIIWCLYNFSEQFFLYKVASDCFYSGVYNVWCG